ncbi:hypothetical protein DGG96_07290 [Legionella qingyii]|uniref:Uncharacterized protein n=1 Tax=Legionella qingyii TaxID=2184757 RepID=A0A317U7B9_9GAMM|nr:hypothetical protein DGG96_07290 [Legionella qingyii]
MHGLFRVLTEMSIIHLIDLLIDQSINGKVRLLVCNSLGIKLMGILISNQKIVFSGQRLGKKVKVKEVIFREKLQVIHLYSTPNCVDFRSIYELYLYLIL